MDFEKSLNVDPRKLVTSRKQPITDSPIYATLQQVANGADPFHTDYYSYFLSRGNRHEDAGRYVSNFLKRYNEKKASREFDISARIDSRGRIVLEKGYEDSAIAAYLQENSVPVEIVKRDSSWAGLVEKLWGVRKKKYSYMPICQPDEHPEFAGWEFARTDARRKMLVPALGSLKGQRWLDVGSLTGYYSRMLEKQGAEVDAIERHRPYAEIGKRLNIVEGTSVDYICQDLLDWLKDHSHDKYDGILCLSIIHNIAQAGKPKEALWALKTLSKMAPRMFFDIGQRSEGGAVEKTGLDLQDDSIDRFVRINTEYSRVKLLGKDADYHDRQLLELRA